MSQDNSNVIRFLSLPLSAFRGKFSWTLSQLPRKPRPLHRPGVIEKNDDTNSRISRIMFSLYFRQRITTVAARVMHQGNVSTLPARNCDSSCRALFLLARAKTAARLRSRAKRMKERKKERERERERERSRRENTFDKLAHYARVFSASERGGERERERERESVHVRAQLFL